MHELVFREVACLDTDRLARLYRCLGERQADLVICEAMEALALALARIARARTEGNLDAVAEQAATLEEIGRTIGLTRLRRVSADVRACAVDGAGGRIALDATMARLHRVGDVSLAAIWDPKDITV